jgi:hypothetical protein
MAPNCRVSYPPICIIIMQVHTKHLYYHYAKLWNFMHMVMQIYAKLCNVMQTYANLCKLMQIYATQKWSKFKKYGENYLT